eukprot:TRINITY_DN8498_c0_g1_i1.p1 TRINITY_DN8498_c0_g1~~TRINITY_DN8498_c0_g1_i1.p1  ORF type:complete len:117 (-),score=19.22 TRINITY_DN8498_c0_g1_i1:51-401(-)
MRETFRQRSALVQRDVWQSDQTLRTLLMRVPRAAHQISCHWVCLFRGSRCSICPDRSSPYSALIPCLLYTSDAADEEDSVDLGGRRIIKKKKKKKRKGIKVMRSINESRAKLVNNQ